VQAAALLPPESVQYQSIQAKIAQLPLDLPNDRAGNGVFTKLGAAMGPVALVIWKLKAVLFGLAKASTLLSMFAFFGVFWTMHGWAFALGLVLSIYLHEMGHVIELRRLGIPAGAPMFIPGLGAIIQLRNVSLTPLADSRIGLAGPIYGLFPTVFCAALFFVTHAGIWSALASTNALINLFNLVPVWQLDGSRGMHSFTRNQRLAILGLALALWAAGSGIFFAIALGASYRLLFTKDASPKPDNSGLMQYAALMAAYALTLAVFPLK
jgi:Zn-dependent protease